jgi:hypothetical protein
MAGNNPLHQSASPGLGQEVCCSISDKGSSMLRIKQETASEHSGGYGIVSGFDGPGQTSADRIVLGYPDYHQYRHLFNKYIGSKGIPVAVDSFTSSSVKALNYGVLHDEYNFPVVHISQKELNAGINCLVKRAAGILMRLSSLLRSTLGEQSGYGSSHGVLKIARIIGQSSFSVPRVT